MGRPPGPLAQVEEQAGRRERVQGHVQAGERGQLRRAAEACTRVLCRLPRGRGQAVDPTRRDAQRPTRCCCRNGRPGNIGSGTKWPRVTGRPGPRRSRSNAADLPVSIEIQAGDRSDERFRCSEKDVSK